MKLLLELWQGVSALVTADESKGSRKLEIAFLGLAVMLIAPEIALGVGILAGGYAIGQGLVDAAEAKKAS